ncbi:hypothetical protein EDC04DRAFT_2600375 [Pisolithus marmoratus]|nr:hypothetical protein EDC04DRAFT_2600375 [Pisolithus marmoratus]
MAGLAGCVLTGFTFTLHIGGMIASLAGSVLTGLTPTLHVGGMTGRLVAGYVLTGLTSTLAVGGMTATSLCCHCKVRWMNADWTHFPLHVGGDTETVLLFQDHVNLSIEAILSCCLLTFHGDIILLVSIGLPGRSYHPLQQWIIIQQCKFITVKSMVCHAVGKALSLPVHALLILVIFLQGTCHSWNKALVLSVIMYNASHIQENVTKAVNVAFQQYGDNVAELCDEILKIITENKMVCSLADEELG